MGKQMNVPKLRFPEFNGEWESKSFGELYTFRSTNSFSRDNLNYEVGEVKNIHYGDIHTKFNTHFDISKEIVPFLNCEIQPKKVPADFYCCEGDLIIADASEDYADIGKAIEIVRLNNEKTVAGLHTLHARPDIQELAIGFGGHIMKSDQIRLQIKTIAQGTKVLCITTGRLSNIFVNYPTHSEQTKISTFLTAIDDKISILKKKKSLFELYKKGVMQQLFSQELRFKDDDGNDFPDWIERKLGEIALKKSSTISANKIEENYGEFIIYGASGILKKVDFFIEENDYISIIKDGAGVGRIFYCAGKSSVLGTMDIIKPKEELNTYYLYCLLSNIDFVKYISGSTIPHIYFKDYSGEICGIPCYQEQTKIANFLTSLDDKITQCSIQINKMDLWKKGLLQQMFV